MHSAIPQQAASIKPSVRTGGRPGALGYAHFLVTRRRCQASSVPGVKIRCNRRPPGQQRGQGGEDGTVSPVRSRARNLPTQDRDLMAEDQDLWVFGDVAARQEHKPAEHLA
jgi:hypothetical protein